MYSSRPEFVPLRADGQCPRTIFQALHTAHQEIAPPQVFRAWSCRHQRVERVMLTFDRSKLPTSNLNAVNSPDRIDWPERPGCLGTPTRRRNQDSVCGVLAFQVTISRLPTSLVTAAQAGPSMTAASCANATCKSMPAWIPRAAIQGFYLAFSLQAHFCISPGPGPSAATSPPWLQSPGAADTRRPPQKVTVGRLPGIRLRVGMFCSSNTGEAPATPYGVIKSLLRRLKRKMKRLVTAHVAIEPLLRSESTASLHVLARGPKKNSITPLGAQATKLIHILGIL